VKYFPLLFYVALSQLQVLKWERKEACDRVINFGSYRDQIEKINGE
jgi:hypothetical protein